MREPTDLPAPEVSATATGPGPMRISGLMIAVVVAGVAAAVLSPVRFTRPFLSLVNSFDNLNRATGVFLTPLAAALAAALAGQIWRRARGQASTRWPIAPVLWRTLALAALAAFLVEEAAILRFLDGHDRATSSLRPWEHRWEVRVFLLPSCGAMLLTGVILAMLAGRAGPAPTRRPSSAWASVLMAGVAGVALVASNLMIGYLILIAVECVGNAMIGAPFAARPSLEARILATMPATAIAAVACLVTAGLVARDLRLAAAGRESRWSAPGLAVGLVATAASAGFLLLRTLPGLQPVMVEGLGAAVGPREFGLILVGFGALAAGLVARGLGRPTPLDATLVSPPAVPRLTGRAGRSATTLLLLALILVGWANICEENASIKNASPSWLTAHVQEPIAERTSELWSNLERQPILAAILYMPGFWFPAVVAPWLLGRSLVLCRGAGRGRPAPMDLACEIPGSARRFALAWLAPHDHHARRPADPRPGRPPGPPLRPGRPVPLSPRPVPLGLPSRPIQGTDPRLAVPRGPAAGRR